MNIKIILYIIIIPLTLWGLESLDINKYFKKNRYYQSRVLALLLTLAISYLVTNFFYDFFINSKFI